MKKVLIIAGNARSLVANRKDLISAMLAAGHQVEALVPEADFLESVNELGIPIHRIRLGRTGINPLRDASAILEMCRLIKTITPDVVFSYTVKPVIFGTFAARLAGVRNCYSMVTGLGHVYTTRTMKTRLLKTLVSWLYRVSFNMNRAVFFQNPDDIKDFKNLGILRARHHHVRTYGSGIALDRYPLAPMPTSALTFLFIGRLLTEKGVAEYCEAAKSIKREIPEVRFIAVGPFESSLPHSIRKEDYELWKSEGYVEFVGGVDDVKSFIAQSHVFVLPSYREGTPRSVLEAMSMGRAIITSDAPGCRETVEEARNGYLVPLKDSETLANRMRRFVDDPNLVVQMGAESRRLVEKYYDVREVNKLILETMTL